VARSRSTAAFGAVVRRTTCNAASVSILQAGGSAVDAAIATSAVLGVVEAQ
jgi:gamma-glutamyltranspeptidase